MTNDGDHRGDRPLARPAADNRYDGTHETQAPIPVGGSFAYRVAFPDPGLYWYHPHIREDYGQEMGLYGNILVESVRSRLLAAGAPRGPPDAGRHPDRGRKGRAIQPLGDELRRRWAGSATCCWLAASRNSP